MNVSPEISAFSPEDAPKIGKRCAVADKPFAPGDKVYSVLYEEDGQIRRMDLCAAAYRTTPRPENALAWWSSTVREEGEKDKNIKLAPNDALTALFVSLADKPGQEALRYALALLLARRRVLKFDYEENASMRSDPETANSIYVYSPRNETGYFVPIVAMTDRQIAEVQDRLVALLETPTAFVGDEEEKEEPETASAGTNEEPKRVFNPSVDERRRLQAAFSAFDESEIAEAAAQAARATLGE